MPTQETLNILLKNSEDTQTSGVMHFTAYSSSDRAKRASIALLVCWLLAGVTLFIPIAHFFLVPAFLIAGPVLFFLRFKQNESKEKVAGNCPNCSKQVTIPLENNDKLPKRTYCPACDKAVEIIPQH